MHRVDRVDHLGEQPLLGPRTATTMQNWVAPASRVACAAASDLVEVEERVHVDAGVEAHRLRAERAVLGARARLGVDQALELDLGAAVREPHLVGERDERRQLVEREVGDREHLVAGEAAALVEQRALGGLQRHRRILGVTAPLVLTSERRAPVPSSRRSCRCRSGPWPARRCPPRLASNRPSGSRPPSGCG